jgi:arylsulfatase A-like enzyme
MPEELTAGMGSSQNDDSAPPNILFIMVDEMRFPTVFPEKVHSVAEFLAKSMPNLFQLWERGVKFAHHYTAATACTPARGVLISGLYSQQSWLTQTIKAAPFTNLSISPVLNHAYPTYGRLLKTPAIRRRISASGTSRSRRPARTGWTHTVSRA